MFKVGDIVEYDFYLGRFTVIETCEEWSLVDFDNGWKKIKNEALELSQDQTKLLVNCGNGRSKDKCRMQILNIERDCVLCKVSGIMYRDSSDPRNKITLEQYQLNK